MSIKFQEFGTVGYGVREKWEVFLDHSYFDLWCVRDKDFPGKYSQRCFHFAEEKDARAFYELTKKMR